MSKVSKAQAQYRNRDMSADTVCGNCVYMNEDGTCDRVQGIVAADHTCDLWSFR